MITFRDPHPEVKTEEDLPELYQFLDDFARDRDRQRLRRGLARMAAVVVHRLDLLDATGADADVDAELYLIDTLSVALRTSRALIESIDPLDTQPLTDGN